MKAYWERASSFTKQLIMCVIGVIVILVMFAALVLFALSGDVSQFIMISAGVGVFLVLWDMFGPKWYEV